MPKYDYGCNHCGFLWDDVVQSINDSPKKKCPKCNKMTLERLISGGLQPFVRGEATTLGQLAEQNTKKMGRYELQEKRAKNKEDTDAGLKRHQEEIKQIGKMNETQKERYVDNG
jgi:putative FmdB family regulatory protein